MDSALMDIARHFGKELVLETGIHDSITAAFENQPLSEILGELEKLRNCFSTQPEEPSGSDNTNPYGWPFGKTYNHIFPVLFLTLLLHSSASKAQESLLDREVSLSQLTGEISVLLREMSRKGNFPLPIPPRYRCTALPPLPKEGSWYRDHLADIFRFDSIQFIEENNKILLAPVRSRELPYPTTGSSAA